MIKKDIGLAKKNLKKEEAKETLDFFLTYGWAILVIIVGIVGFMWWQLFSVHSEICEFAPGSGLLCENFDVTSSEVALEVRNLVNKTIKVNQLTKKFGPFTAVENISFNLDRGEVLGFLGPNGAGKTTTMRMITGFLSPRSGDVLISNLNIQEFPLSAKKQIGYVPEGAPLYGEMTVLNFLKFI